MIASQLVPLLANLDPRLLLQMLPVANPDLASTISAFVSQSSAAGDPRQMSAALSQLAAGAVQFPKSSSTVNRSASGSSQNQTNVGVSSASSAVEATQSTDAVRSVSTTTCDSVQSSVYSEISGIGVGNAASPPVVSQSESQSSQRSRSLERSCSPFDSNRPSSTASTSSSSVFSTGRQLGDRHTSSVPGPLVYTCHLCSFRSSHRTRFAEHMSSEFCTKNILAMATRAAEGETTRRRHCSHCSFSTYLSEEFEQHLQTHRPSSLYHCTHCDYTGPSIGALKVHYRRSHRNKSFVFQASMLGKKFEHESHSSNSNRSNMAQPQSIDLDPVVKLCDVSTMDHSDISRCCDQN